MKIFYSLLILIFTSVKYPSHLTNLNDMTNMSLLCLGDSYTIGESIPITESFPYQTIKLLRKEGFNFQPPEIIAKTGWTTDELQTAIYDHKFLPSYDFVTLLIGVNNQYRGRNVVEYNNEFESLLKQAIAFAGSKPDRVIVLSIPDWGITPFAEARLPDGQGRDRKKIADEIETYNSANKTISGNYQVHYIDITPGTRKATTDRSLLAADGLHPSAKEYAEWAEKIVTIIKRQL